MMNSRLEELRDKQRDKTAKEMMMQVQQALAVWCVAASERVAQDEATATRGWRRASVERARRFLQSIPLWTAGFEALQTVETGEWSGAIEYERRSYEEGGGSYSYREVRLKPGLLILEGGRNVSDGESASGNVGIFRITMSAIGDFEEIERLDEWTTPLQKLTGEIDVRSRSPNS